MGFRILLVMLCALCISSVHDFYVSITYLKRDGNELKIRHRIFKDDLELVIGPFEVQRDKPLDDALQLRIFEYLETHAQLMLNGEVKNTTLNLALVEGEGATCTVECRRSVQLPFSIQSLSFDNRILLKDIDAQINMTHFISDEGRRSENLDARMSTFEIY